ncbi:MAG: allantoinase AllB, partial [Crocinitomicaceae bacterium]|nr:allantoinase AllB [Crocinitomicaceae bacterium]
SEGKITSVEMGAVRKNGFEFRDYGTDVIMPGLIDSHVHINEPGRTEWEGFDTATRSAAAGGITLLVDMPLNSSPVSIDKKSFQQKLDSAQSALHVNCAFWGGIIPENIDSLDELLHSGVLGIKAFLTHSGIDEFPNVSEEDLRRAMPILKKNNALLLVHCELNTLHSGIDLLEASPTKYSAYLKSRPRVWEDNAIALMIKLCEEFGIRTHIVHLSSSGSIEQLKAARKKGLPLTVETCPHYLVFNAEEIADGATAFKCAPPIREKENNDKLWSALRDGHIDFVVTDHSPAPPEIKELDSGNFKKAWGGIAGLQFSLPVFWTNAKLKGFTIADTARLMSGSIASFLKMDHRKGRISTGYDADITVWNPEEIFMVEKKNIQHRHKVTPYLGMELAGRVVSTYVNGHLVFDEGEFVDLSKGKIILSPH